jgi:arsenate reductase
MSVTIWHNPRCSKSRQTLELLHNRGYEPTVINYLKTPPTREQIEATIKMLNIEPKALLRKTEAIYREMDLSKVKDNDAIIDAMFHNPVLIERPIVIANGKAAIGRPAENILSIL